MQFCVKVDNFAKSVVSTNQKLKIIIKPVIEFSRKKVNDHTYILLILLSILFEERC